MDTQGPALHPLRRRPVQDKVDRGGPPPKAATVIIPGQEFLIRYFLLSLQLLVTIVMKETTLPEGYEAPVCTQTDIELRSPLLTGSYEDVSNESFGSDGTLDLI